MTKFLIRRRKHSIFSSLVCIAMEATPEMAKYCFHVVRQRLKNLPVDPPPPSVTNDPAPIFVCFKSASGDLRGCIGSFRQAPLHQQLRQYAAAAAFEDSRFAPIRSEAELADLKCTVSLLHSFEETKAWNDWDVGIHGIEIEFLQRFRGTFLPSVAREQGWDHRKTLQRLVQKAGYGDTVTDDLLKGMYVRRYQESSASASYSDCRF
jgi:uncharacterized protein (TIGR00296 family)